MTRMVHQILVLFKFPCFLKKGLLLTQRHNLLKHTMCLFALEKKKALTRITLFGFFTAVFFTLLFFLEELAPCMVEVREPVSEKKVWMIQCESHTACELAPAHCIHLSAWEVTQRSSGFACSNANCKRVF